MPYIQRIGFLDRQQSLLFFASHAIVVARTHPATGHLPPSIHPGSGESHIDDRFGNNLDHHYDNGEYDPTVASQSSGRCSVETD